MKAYVIMWKNKFDSEEVIDAIFIDEQKAKEYCEKANKSDKDGHCRIVIYAVKGEKEK